MARGAAKGGRWESGGRVLEAEQPKSEAGHRSGGEGGSTHFAAPPPSSPDSFMAV